MYFLPLRMVKAAFQAIVFGPWGRLPIITSNLDSLKEKIKERFKIKEFTLFSDENYTKEVEKITDKMQIYVKCKNYMQDLPENVSNDIIKEKGEEIKVKFLSRPHYDQMLKDKGSPEPVFDYTIKKCKDHDSNVTCMNCMEKRITLAPQIYREVDYVEFESTKMVENFISTWKGSLRQQFGLLIGRKLVRDNQTRIIVSAIWTIEQENYPDGIFLKDIPEFPFKSTQKNNKIVLDVVGIIYTDLFVKESKQLSYKSELNCSISSFELSIFYKIQKALKKSSNGNYDNLVNICATDDQGSVSLRNFMISKQFIALMDANLLKLCTDPASFINWKKKDIVYFYNNEYNLQVSVNANPFLPIEYFVVTSEVGYSETSYKIFFHETPKLNSIKKISAYFDGEYDDFEKYKDFNLLIEMKNFFPNTPKIFNAVINSNETEFFEILTSEEFCNFVVLLDEERVFSWNCPACTFLNSGDKGECEICGTAKQ